MNAAHRSPVVRFVLLLVTLLATHTSYAARLPHQLDPDAAPCTLKLSAATPAETKQLAVRKVVKRAPKLQAARLLFTSVVLAPNANRTQRRLAGSSAAFTAFSPAVLIATQGRPFALRI